jgi:hypothetical protein
MVSIGLPIPGNHASYARGAAAGGVGNTFHLTGRHLVAPGGGLGGFGAPTPPVSPAPAAGGFSFAAAAATPPAAASAAAAAAPAAFGFGAPSASPAPAAPPAPAFTGLGGASYSDAKVANRDVRGFGWEIAHAAVSRRPPIFLAAVVARTEGYA